MSIARSLYDFTPDPNQSPKQLNIKVGQTLAIISKENDNWWLAENEYGEQGLVPSQYCEVFELPPQLKEIGQTKGPPARKLMVRAIRRYNHPFKSTHLKFEKGDLIKVVEVCFPRWWIGELERDPSQVGVFPAAFIEIYSDKTLIQSSPVDLKKESPKGEENLSIINIKFFIIILSKKKKKKQIPPIWKGHHQLCQNQSATPQRKAGRTLREV